MLYIFNRGTELNPSLLFLDKWISMKFSERKGLTPVSEIIQIDSMNNALRISLWNVLLVFIFENSQYMTSYEEVTPFRKFARSLWFSYFKQPIDSIHLHNHVVVEHIRKYFFGCQWYEVYDFIEFTLNSLNYNELYVAMNNTLEKEMSGYRFVNGILTDITDRQEVEMLGLALNDNEFPGVQEHLYQALKHLSDRNNPDFRNSIKESISALENIARIVSSAPNSTLADALKAIEKKQPLHPAFKESILKMYGYASDSGIRHAVKESDPILGAAEAKFFLFFCTSLINYLKTKM